MLLYPTILDSLCVIILLDFLRYFINTYFMFKSQLEISFYLHSYDFNFVR